MNCVICQHGETKSGKTTVTLESNHMTLVITGVPAQVCENCGEAYVDEEIAVQLPQTVEDAARAGVSVDVREYVAA